MDKNKRERKMPWWVWLPKIGCRPTAWWEKRTVNAAVVGTGFCLKIRVHIPAQQRTWPRQCPTHPLGGSAGRRSELGWEAGQNNGPSITIFVLSPHTTSVSQHSLLLKPHTFSLSRDRKYHCQVSRLKSGQLYICMCQGRNVGSRVS